MSRSARPYSLKAGDIRLQGLQWGSGAPVLALHGWLDNANSFSLLAPALQGYSVCAPDLPGQGISGHRPMPGPYNELDELPLLDAVLDDMVDATADEPVTLIGHSRGAVLAFLYALACPERVRSLVLLDACAPRPLSRSGPVEQLRESLASWRRLAAKAPRSASSRERLQRVRERQLSPGAADALLARGASERDGRWSWNTDRRLYASQLYRYSLEQIRAMLEQMHTPTLVLAASDNPWREWVLDCAGRLPSATVVQCTGSHHLHLEADTAPEVQQRVLSFLRKH